MPLLSVIINNFNTKDLLKDCINNLLTTEIDMKIIVSDSGSTDGSASMVEEIFANNSKIVLIKRENTGISKGYNEALKYADSTYLLYLGTDAYPDKNTILGLIEYFGKVENKNIGMATARLVTRDGSMDWDAHRGDLNPWSAFTHFSMLERIFPKSRLFSQYFLGYEDLTKPHEIGSCISHFMFVRKSVQDKVGLWDEEFFVFGEDIDFCYRVRKSGYKIMYLPQWETLHYKGAGIGRSSSKDLKNQAQISIETKKVLARERTRAMKIFYTKHKKQLYPFYINFIVFLGIAFLEIIRNIYINLKFGLKA